MAVALSSGKRRSEGFLRWAGARRKILACESPTRNHARARPASKEAPDMKISDASKVGGARPVRAPQSKGAAAATASAGPVDRLTFAGIPDAELTPRVREALISLMEEVQSLRAELERTRARIGELEELADADPLLGVFNRRAFVRELNRALAMAERYGAPSSLVFVDVNDLKKINDRYGHAAGDAALAHVAQALVANVRQTDAVGRLGGDEFGVILTQTDAGTAKVKADSLAAAVSAEPFEWRGERMAVRIACGVVEIRKGQTVDDALETADTAMYDAKRKR
jgi:diguanylate cyclase (GGDEF)-like protein